MAQGGGCLCKCFLAMVAAAILALVVVLVIQYENPTPPRYYASIPSISPINSEINVILGVERRSLWGWACLERGTDVAVAYQGLPLAFAATGGEVCAPWWKLWSVQRTIVVARTLPIVGTLIADTLRGAQVFEVAFLIQSEAPQDGKLVTCVVKPFLDKGDTACDVQS
ncbi:unnamed protein product [Alopecurus aequalis]